MLTTPVRYGTNISGKISDYSSGVQPGANSGIGHRLRAGNNAKMIHKTMGVSGVARPLNQTVKRRSSQISNTVNAMIG